MATRKFILSIGQSQGAAQGERVEFEDLLPNISPRNPWAADRALTYSRGITRDTFTMPGTWPSGYQTVNLKGRATSAIKKWTLFNPSSTFYDTRPVGPEVADLDYISMHTTTYPGYARAYSTQENNRQRIVLTAVFQEDPSGRYVTRLRTGERLQISTTWTWDANYPSTIELESSTPLDPPLGTGEMFQLEPQVAASGSSTTQIKTDVRFGGYTDAGGQYTAQSTSFTGETHDGFKVAPYPITWDTPSTGSPISFRTTTLHFRPGQCLRFGDGSTPAGLANTTSTQNGGTILPTAAGTSTVRYYVTRVEYDGDDAQVFISDTRYGSEIEGDASVTAATGTWTVVLMPQTIGTTMAGMRVRFTSGTMEGESYALTDNVEDSGGDFLLQTTSAMSTTPTAADTFVIEPMPVNGEVPPWDEWGFFLPECRFNGPAFNLSAIQIGATVVTSGVGTTLTFLAEAAATLYEGAPIRLYSRADISTATVAQTLTGSGSITGPGQRLFVKDLVRAGLNWSFSVSTTYGGDAVSDCDSAVIVPAQQFVFWVDEHPDRGNPFPPGFNYDNGATLPSDYNAYYGTNNTVYYLDPGASYVTSLAHRMHQHIADEVLVFNFNIPGTSLARRETYDIDIDDNSTAATLGLEHGWFDPSSLLDWAPGGEPDNCYALMEKNLRAAKRVADAAGDSLKCLGVWNLQGEADAMRDDWTAAYEVNLRAFVRKVRELLVELEMWDGPFETIPWWQPQLPTTNSAVDWGSDSYVSVGLINTAIGNLATEDSFFVTRAITDHTISYDNVHYSAGYMVTLGSHAFDDWKTIAESAGSRTRLDICNQALKNLGETKVITSLTEDTTAARLCNRYYGIALQTMLEAFPWPFATRTATLAARSANDRDDIDWQYAYDLPTNYLRIITLGPDSAGANVLGEAYYAVENNTLYTNQADTVIRYVVKSPDPASYTQHFSNALAAQLAAEIAPGVMQGDSGVQMAQQMLQLATFHVQQAREFSVNSQRNEDINSREHPFDN